MQRTGGKAIRGEHPFPSAGTGDQRDPPQDRDADDDEDGMREHHSPSPRWQVQQPEYDQGEWDCEYGDSGE